MKKAFIFNLFCTVAFFSAHAQVVFIPDPNFKANLVSASTTSFTAFDASNNQIKIDTNNDGEIQLSEAQNVYSLRLFGEGSPIQIMSSLEGIRSFSNLVSIDCRSNALTSLDLSDMTNLIEVLCSVNQIDTLILDNTPALNSLHCDHNQLTSISPSILNKIGYLDCRNNFLTSLDFTGATNLSYLLCDNNELTSIVLPQPSMSPYLQEISCVNNNVTTLDTNGFLYLKKVDLSYNSFTSINIHNNPTLYEIYCSNNLLTSLNLSNLPVIYLDCSSNNLTGFNFNNVDGFSLLNCANNNLSVLNNLQDVRELNCSFNTISSLDVTPYGDLEVLVCSFNAITTLDVRSNFQLRELICNNNQLTELQIKNSHSESYLNFSGNPDLNYVCADDSEVSVVQNLASVYGYTNCVVDSACALSTDSFAKTAFTLYPNPVKDVVHISGITGAAIENITIYNTLGQIVYSTPAKSLENVISLNIADLASGSYFVKIVSGKRLATINFIKK